MRYYWGSEEVPERAFDDENHYWLKTNDIGYVEDRKVCVVDREKDIFKVNSFQLRDRRTEAYVYVSENR